MSSHCPETKKWTYGPSKCRICTDYGVLLGFKWCFVLPSFNNGVVIGFRQKFSFSQKLQTCYIYKSSEHRCSVAMFAYPFVYPFPKLSQCNLNYSWCSRYHLLFPQNICWFHLNAPARQDQHFFWQRHKTTACLEEGHWKNASFQHWEFCLFVRSSKSSVFNFVEMGKRNWR